MTNNYLLLANFPRLLCSQIALVFFLAVVAFNNECKAQTPQNNAGSSLTKPILWKSTDLIQPSELALILTKKRTAKPVIFNIGVVEDIKGAKNVGAASKNENIDKLRQNLEKVPKNSLLVIYCGCCPFDKCPNIRPAYSLMKELGFVNGKLLNLPINLQQNWISKGYPMSAPQASNL